MAQLWSYTGDILILVLTSNISMYMQHCLTQLFTPLYIA